MRDHPTRKLRGFLKSFKLIRYIHALSWYYRRTCRRRKPFDLGRRDIPPIPRVVSISLSVLCNARCAFCPSGRGRLHPAKTMSVVLAEKLFGDLREMRFAGTIDLGSMGEILLCPDAFKIIDATRRYLPENRLVLFSNMSLMDEAASEAVLRARPEEINFNVDGACAETYNAMKPGLDYERVMSNVRTLLRKREEMHSNARVVVHVANFRRYMRDAEGRRVALPNDTELVARKMRALLRKSDTIDMTEYGFGRWAVRDRLRKPKASHCEHLYCSRDACYVDPGGRLYLCCLDDNARLSYGSIGDAHLKDLWRNERHVQLWNLIARQLFHVVGDPCSICLSGRTRPSW